MTAKFHQILFKIATVRAMTDTQKDIQRDRRQRSYYLPMLCNSNWTDKNLHWHSAQICEADRVAQIKRHHYIWTVSNSGIFKNKNKQAKQVVVCKKSKVLIIKYYQIALNQTNFCLP